MENLPRPQRASRYVELSTGAKIRAALERSLVTKKPSLVVGRSGVGKSAAITELLGEHEALGGSKVALPTSRTRNNTLLAQAIGHEAAFKLAQAFGDTNLRVPLANSFLARQLHSTGVPVSEIARTLRCNFRSVYFHINGRSRPRPIGFNGPATKITFTQAE